MKKPIIQVTINNMGTILVVRSPFSRQWLFNLSFSKGFTMSKVSAFLLSLSAILFYACVNPSEPETETKPKYKYTYFADTLHKDDMTLWNEGALDKTEYSTGYEWNTVTVTLFDSVSHWSIGSGTYSKPLETSTKPVYWNGVSLVIDWDKLPSNWVQCVIRYSRKTEVK